MNVYVRVCLIKKFHETTSTISNECKERQSEEILNIVIKRKQRADKKQSNQFIQCVRSHDEEKKPTGNKQTIQRTVVSFPLDILYN